MTTQEKAQSLSPHTSELPLTGFRILDMTRFVAGPYCTMLLADAGADVIKIEPPGGEETRFLDPVLSDRDGEVESGYFLRFNRGKRSLCLDLHTERGQTVFADLIRSSDVLVENFRPGVLSRLGFDEAQLRSVNPGLVYCSISGFGHSGGPYGSHPAFAILAEVLAGVLVHNPHAGEPPVWTGLGLGDLFPAALSVGGIALALLRRERTGIGGHVDMAMYDGMVSLNERAIGFAGMLGHDIQIGQQEMIAPFGLFEAKDGYLCIAVIGERVWQGFCRAIDHSELLEDQRLSTGGLRASNMQDVLLPVMRSWLSTRSRAEAAAALLAAGVPAGPVRYASEVLDCPQANHRDMVTTTGFRGQPSHRVAGNPIRITPASAAVVRPVPRAGEHADQILTEVARYDAATIEELRCAGVVS